MNGPKNPEQLKTVIIFDTTLRDGVQATDINADQASALYVAENLAKAGVDVIEAGFPASSPPNFESVKDIAKKVAGPTIAAFARTNPEDIDQAGRALEPAEDRARINVCAPFSDLHIEKRLRTNRDSLLELAVRSTIQARKYTDDVQFSFEDSTRSDPEFLKSSVLAVAEAGATTVMLPDTVGARLPREYAEGLLPIREALDDNGFKHVVVAAHCHNDLGQGAMSTIDALRFGGARQADVTIGGYGERNGNTPLEVIAGVIAVKGGEIGRRTNVDPLQLRNLTHFVAPRALGPRASEKQPFVGRQSYEHGSGMHQHGVLRDERTFKDFSSATFGFDKSFEFKINDQSGKAGIKYELDRLSVDVNDDELILVTEAVKERSSGRGGQNLGHNELEELAGEITGTAIEDKFKMKAFEFSGDNEGHCKVELNINDVWKVVRSDGGVVDATQKAIGSITDVEFEFTGWDVDESHAESDAEIGVYVTVKYNGYEIMAYSKSKLIERASAEACLKAVNMIHRAEERAAPTLNT